MKVVSKSCGVMATVLNMGNAINYMATPILLSESNTAWKRLLSIGRGVL